MALTPEAGLISGTGAAKASPDAPIKNIVNPKSLVNFLSTLQDNLAATYFSVAFMLKQPVLPEPQGGALPDVRVAAAR